MNMSLYAFMASLICRLIIYYAIVLQLKL